MEEGRKQLEAILAEFSETSGIPIALDEHNGFTATFGNVCVSGVYMPLSDQLMIWSEIAALGDDVTAGARALWMLRRHDSWDESRGFTYGLNHDTNVVVLADRRSVLTISSADALAAWIMALVDEATDCIVVMDAKYPFVDDGPIDETEEPEPEPMIREIGAEGKEVP